MAKVIKLKDSTYLYGTIIEHGSNDNGEYIKYSNGTLICTKTVSFTTTVQNAWGVFYESPLLTIGEYAYPFISKPDYINGMCIGQRVGFIEDIINTTRTAFGNMYIARPNSQSEVTFYYNFIAIGKWK